MNVREIMRAKGLTQERLAQLVGVNQATVSRWIRANEIPANAMAVLELAGVEVPTPKVEQMRGGISDADWARGHIEGVTLSPQQAARDRRTKTYPPGWVKIGYDIVRQLWLVQYDNGYRGYKLELYAPVETYVTEQDAQDARVRMQSLEWRAQWPCPALVKFGSHMVYDYDGDGDDLEAKMASSPFGHGST